MGGLKKTSKVAILHELEKTVSPLNDNQSNHVSLIDGMAILQKAKVTGMTFGELSNKLLQTILRMSSNANRIDGVFDTYIKNSIKDAERLKRSSSGSVRFQNIKKEHPVKQWNRFLSIGENKTEMIEFLVHDWSTNEHFNTTTTPFYVTSKTLCYKLCSEGKIMVDELETVQEEADTRLFLRISHASQAEFDKFVIHSPDTDVFIMALAFIQDINGSLFFRTGTGDKKRTISLDQIKIAVERRFMENVTNINKLLKGLLGLYAFTGCDTVSTFTGQGKIKAMKLMSTDDQYVELFCKLGRDVNLDDETFSELEAFTCHLYGSKCDDINHFRYKLYCSKRGKFECEKLPPCQASLYQHCLRANYQCKIWRSAMISNPSIPEPSGYGWNVDPDGISINWMDCNPAPDEV